MLRPDTHELDDSLGTACYPVTDLPPYLSYERDTPTDLVHTLKEKLLSP